MKSVTVKAVGIWDKQTELLLHINTWGEHGKFKRKKMAIEWLGNQRDQVDLVITVKKKGKRK